MLPRGFRFRCLDSAVCQRVVLAPPALPQVKSEDQASVHPVRTGDATDGIAEGQEMRQVDTTEVREVKLGMKA